MKNFQDLMFLVKAFCALRHIRIFVLQLFLLYLNIPHTAVGKSHESLCWSIYLQIVCFEKEMSFSITRGCLLYHEVTFIFSSW